MKKKAAKKAPAKHIRKTATRAKPTESSAHQAAASEFTAQQAAPLFDRVAAILDAACSSVVRAVNCRMVVAYWLIGREIVQELQGGDERAEYGKQVIETLSKQLTQRYGQGYSGTNLRQFRQFYQVFAERLTVIPAVQSMIRHAPPDESDFDKNIPSAETSNSIHHALRDESLGAVLDAVFSNERAQSNSSSTVFHPNLSWTHYRSLMQVEKLAAREFYESEAVAAGWSTRELDRQIHSLYYDRLLLSKDKQGMIQEQRDSSPKFDPAAVLKSSTVLEFLGLPDSPRLHESKLEQAIMDNLQTFLLELGRGFSFVARQKRLVFEDDEFFVDLVFYNYLLKCFVLIDLKIGKLTHQDVGQMDSYIRMYEDLYKVTGDNPTIGLILCSQKNETIARYSMLKESQQLFATKYRLHLPTEEELAKELEREILAIEERRGE